MQEYDRFQKGAANSNTSTRILKQQLEDPSARIIITTIQKLSTFISANKGHEIYDGHVVIIFDECHRSQFGDMHTAITKAFNRYHLFGFTGTPIFAANSASGGNPQLRTTEQAFGDKLHTYTIVDAITDKNVLPFRIDYVNTIKMPDSVADKQVSAIDKENALLAPERIEQIVAYIREHFDQKTKRASHYSLEGKRVRGFNSLLATASIDAARRYYNHFYLQQQDLPSDQRLKVGLIYSFAPNQALGDDLLAEEDFDTDALGLDAREFLEHAIQDYNDLFGTSFDTTCGQVPELLQGPVAAAQAPRDRPRDRGQHVPHRVRRHDAQHALGRQEPAGTRTDPGVLTHQPDPQLGQDLREHRQFPRPRAGDQRRHRPVR